MSNILEKLAVKYADKELALQAVRASAKDSGLELDESSYMKVKLITDHAMTANVPRWQIGIPLAIFFGKFDGDDYLLGVPLSQPYVRNVFMTANIVRVEKLPDDTYRIKTRDDVLQIVVLDEAQEEKPAAVTA